MTRHMIFKEKVTIKQIKICTLSHTPPLSPSFYSMLVLHIITGGTCYQGRTCSHKNFRLVTNLTSPCSEILQTSCKAGGLSLAMAICPCWSTGLQHERLHCSTGTLLALHSFCTFQKYRIHSVFLLHVNKFLTNSFPLAFSWIYFIKAALKVFNWPYTINKLLVDFHHQTWTFYWQWTLSNSLVIFLIWEE